MQLKILLKRMLLVIVLAGFSLSLTFFFYFIPRGSNQYVSGQSPNSQPLPIKSITMSPKLEEIGFGLPVGLEIPKINLNANLEYVGLTPDQAIDTPENQNNAAWFELGPRPGENGNAIITGHYGWKDKKPSAFDNLYKLRKGDKLYVRDDKGMVISFIVRESRRYNPETDASEVFVSNDGKPHLNLITCEGSWNKTTESYSKRLVVFADKE